MLHNMMCFIFLQTTLVILYRRILDAALLRVHNAWKTEKRQGYTHKHRPNKWIKLF